MTWVAALLGIVGAGLVAFAPEMLDHQAAREAVWWSQAAWALGNAIWVGHSLKKRHWPAVVQYSAFELLALRGLSNWR